AKLVIDRREHKVSVKQRDVAPKNRFEPGLRRKPKHFMPTVRRMRVAIPVQLVEQIVISVLRLFIQRPPLTPEPEPRPFLAHQRADACERQSAKPKCLPSAREDHIDLVRCVTDHLLCSSADLD